MRINSIKFKNVFSFGAALNVIDFNNISPSLFQVIGKNGTGKSSLLRIIKISIYQEYEGITIKQVANQTNKRGYIETNVDAKGHNWTIINEFSPDSLRIYKDGNDKPEDLGGKNDIKEFIRNNITDVPYYVFCNLLSLSVNDFKSFLKMDAKSSRLIRDRIFGFYELNSMNEKIAPKISKIQADVDKLRFNIGSLSDNITNTNIKYVELKEKISRKINKDHNDLCEAIAQYKQNIEFYSIYLSQTEDEMCTTNNEINKLHSQILFNKIIDLRDTVQKTKNMVALSESGLSKKEKEFNDLSIERNTLSIKLSLEKLKELKETEKEIEKQIDSYVSLTNIQVESIQSLEKLLEIFQEISVVNQIHNEAELIHNENISLYERIQKINAYIEKGEAYIEKTETEIEQNKQNKAEQNKLLGELTNKLNAYINGVCHVCQSDFTSDDRKAEIPEMEAEIEIIKQKIAKYDELVATQITKKNEAIQKVRTATTQKTELKNGLNDISKKLNSLSKINEKHASLFVDFILNRKPVIDEYSSLVEIKNKIVDSLSMDVDREYDEVDKEYKNLQEKLELNSKELKSLENKHQQILSQISVLSNTTNNKESVDIVFKYDNESDYIEQIERLKETNKKLKEQNKALSLDLQLTEKQLKELEAELGEAELGEYSADDLESKYKILKQEHNDKAVKRDGIIMKISEFRSDLRSQIKQMLALSFDIENMDEVKTIKELIASFEDTLDKSNKEIDLLSEQLQYNKLIQVILSDDGVKQFILKDFIPSINSEIGNILNHLGLPLVAKFDNDFKVKIIRFGEEVSISSISVGQKKMIDCAILLSIVTILKMKYSSINIIFYDEMFSSLDSDYSVIILELVKKICCEKLKLQTLVVNHAYMPSNYFEYVIPIVNRNNFSSIEVLKTQDFISKNLKEFNK